MKSPQPQLTHKDFGGLSKYIICQNFNLETPQTDVVLMHVILIIWAITEKR
jgi:hypothetical protein